MSVVTAPAPLPPASSRKSYRHRWTVEEYFRMGEAGLFSPDARVELLDGEIWDMSPIGPRHAVCVKRLNRLVDRQVGESAIVQIQDPVCLSGNSEPEPDVALIRPPIERYAQIHPGPADVLLLIEVADTTLDHDHKIKGPAYAESAIAEYWIVDLTGNQILVFSDPTDGHFGVSSVARPGEVLSPRSLPSVSIRVSEVLGLG